MTIEILKQILAARRKAFICIAALILINIGLYAYSSAYLGPRLDGFQRRWSEMRLQAASGGSLEPAAIFRQGNADLKSWNERIPPKKGFAAFIGKLFETATDNTLSVGTINYKPTQVKGQDILAYTIGFNVSGGYAAIKSFIADIESMQEIAVIDNISLSGKSEEETVDMRVQMTAYFREENP